MGAFVIPEERFHCLPFAKNPHQPRADPTDVLVKSNALHSSSSKEFSGYLFSFLIILMDEYKLKRADVVSRIFLQFNGLFMPSQFNKK